MTSLWLMLNDLAGNRTSVVHRLHLKYGSAVRIGPNELSFADVGSVKQIYGPQTSFIKAPVYEGMGLAPDALFSIRDKREHSQRRRLFNRVFSMSYLLDSEFLVRKQIERLVQRIERRLGCPLNVLVLFRLSTFDIVGELFLEQPSDELSSLDNLPGFLHDMDHMFFNSTMGWYFPWLLAFCKLLPIPALQYRLRATTRMLEYGDASLEKYILQHGRVSSRKDLLSKVLSSNEVSGEAALNDRSISAEIGNAVFAATDTTSTTLTYLFWELTRFPIWQRRLREELLTASISSPKKLTCSDIMSLPLLDAVINEVLRLHSAAPVGLQRVTPPAGKSLGGYFVPAETIVSAQCYTTHRDPAVFPNPDAFKPERWHHITDEMKDLFMPFSKGPRTCLGISLALMNLKLVTVRLLQSFTVEAAPRTTEKSMSMTDHFLLVPKGQRCDLIFRRLD